MTSDDPLAWETPAWADGVKAVDVIREHLAMFPAGEIGPMLGAGGVSGDGRTVGINDALNAGEVLRVDPTWLDQLRDRGRITEPADVPLAVLHEDEHVLIVDKPGGMHVHPMGPYREDTLVGALLWRAGARPDRPWADWRPYPAHRLDRVTSGAIAFARSRLAQDGFRLLFERDEVSRTYHAVVRGEVDGDTGTIDAPLGVDPEASYRRAVIPESEGGQPAVTHWRVLERAGGQTLVEVQLGTGRTHQIRAHLASLGHAVVGDDLYADGTRPDGGPTAIALRAVRLTFPHPITGTQVDVTTSGLRLPWPR